MAQHSRESSLDTGLRGAKIQRTSIHQNILKNSSLMILNSAPDNFKSLELQRRFFPGGGRGKDSHIEQTGMLAGNFEFNP